MERVEFTVRGEGASTLPRAFHDIAEDSRELYDGNGFVVAVTENHYRMELTEVQATTVLELIDETTCEVTIIAGGGGYGLTADAGGRESEEVRKVRRRLETFCEDRNLTVERM
ncbi:hypothetical protein EGO51_12630 [Haloarcula hispanica]|uniref:Uncharacterized protein n=2 Tax=Haloarcula TaxID=2237 RepID=M0K4L8_9EURY|nr:MULTISPECIES: hypothetical protein [Haloarcula]AJF25022.1 hypothetical protein SG26_04465 [Haloarcula sp. CBA1115]EMA15758.1 hypothetical protein C436_02796 [Haloarcula sinaiiensis ATCC 33800]KAA9406354.1 hypothetical protein Har1131_05875 [Haloarcula sp. CBA1131]KAA9410611.1 hypothetical protein EGO51_12630 [Haloarcula hispanica]QUJ72455.1 hypothetical protein KDQ40_01490 [Haloarcula sinaiiensis ATCC 33800]